jgi:hypothetical protein
MTARIRFDSPFALRDDDLAPLLVSWGFALGLAAAWLTLVHLTALPAIDSVAAPAPTFIDFAPGRHDEITTASPSTGLPSADQKRQSKVPRSVTSEVAVAGIFAAAMAKQAVSEVTHLIPGVVPIRGETRGDASKRALSTNVDVRPGMSTFAGVGDGAKAASVGDVKRGASIDRADFRAHQLPAVSAPALDNASADATELGAFVRARVSQLQTCYERAGGSDFAGIVALRLTLGEGGVVRAAEIVRRTWSGPGAAEAEACLVRIARGWRVPTGHDGATLTLPISFTRGT